MSNKYKTEFKCNICGLEFSTGECKTKIGMWIRKKMIMKKHYHTKAEVAGYNMFGVYIPTTKKKWEK
jgi:hypothetical protein